MKQPGAAAAVLALHLLGLRALWLPATAHDGPGLPRPPERGVLQVSLRSETLPPAPPVLPAAPPPPRTAPAMPAPLPLPVLQMAVAAPAAPATPSLAAIAAAIAAPATAAAPTAVAALAAPAAPSAAPADAPPTTPTPAAAPPAAQPALVQAQADRRDCPAAPHPAALRERGIEGEVRLLVRVGIDGRAAEVRLQQASGWRLFDHAAMAQAQACRFVPARRGVQAVESWVEFPVRFSLKG